MLVYMTVCLEKYARSSLSKVLILINVIPECMLNLEAMCCPSNFVVLIDY